MFWTKNGPYTTVEDYQSTAVNLFYGYEPKFPVNEPAKSSRYVYSISEGLATARPVFDHLDWSRSNIIVHPNGDCVAGIIDWEYAAFIPDPEDYFLQNVPSERVKNEDWWSLFEGVADRNS
jgi:Phosphotransferase enzyme family